MPAQYLIFSLSMFSFAGGYQHPSSGGYSQPQSQQSGLFTRPFCVHTPHPSTPTVDLVNHHTFYALDNVKHVHICRFHWTTEYPSYDDDHHDQRISRRALLTCQHIIC